MVEHADIEGWFGAEIATYFANKRRGGDAGNKGTRYEDHFVAYKVAEAAAALIDAPSGADPHIRSQADGFVDDVRIAIPSATDYYQLKNADSVNWSSGEHPIATDFALQFRLSRHLDEPGPSTALVVPTANLAAMLRKNIPGAIAAHTQVRHFPWAVTLNRLVLESDTLRNLLRKLASVENASDDVLSGVMYALMNACLERPEGATALELFAQAAKLFPNQLRLMPADADSFRYLFLRDAFMRVLANIEGLSYGAERGFFHWSGFGTSGIFESDVSSDAFKAFQDEVVRRNPATFEDFEKVVP
jgi:hypothetical protein